MNVSALARRLRKTVGDRHVLHRPDDLIVYEQDGIMVNKRPPDLVVLPATTQQVSDVVRIAREAGFPVVARGAGTGLTGGAIAERGGVLVALTRMTRVIEIDTASRTAHVEAGVVNAELTALLAPTGLFFAPDPGSQVAATIGGNIANNAGGPHCLAYGVTSNHVLGLEVVLADGTVVWMGGGAWDAPGYDLPGILSGSEGTLGIVTSAIVRLMVKREAVRTLLAVFDTMEAACEATSAVIAAGVVPEALEIIDGMAMRAVNATLQVGFPEDAEAALIVEVEGLEESMPVLVARLEEICGAHGARRIQTARTGGERLSLWKGRKHAGGALGKLGRHTIMLDLCVPRSRLVEMMQKVTAAGERWGVRIANFFHAGDGNLHPNLIFDFDPESEEFGRVVSTTEEVMRACVEMGGTITGEHGIGLEKREYLGWMYSETDLAAMRRVKSAFDPAGSLNPEKIFPMGRAVHTSAKSPPIADQSGETAWT